MGEEQKILDSFRKVFRALRLSSVRIEKKLGISTAQLFVLSRLQSGEWITINELASRTNTDQSSVSVVVKKLVDEKFLLKKPHPTDKRSSIISLSLLGQKYSRTNEPLIADRLLKGIESLSSSEQKQLTQLLNQLLTAAGLANEEASLFFEEGKPRGRPGKKNKA